MELVKEIFRDGKKIFICEKCGLGYENESIANKCEEYCSKHKGCSLEIIKEAIYKSDDY
jgi:hypothetical protein